MATTTIPWGDGSGGNIYLTYPSASGSQTVQVTSDANTGAARSKVVTFTSGVGSITRSLTVSQDAGVTEQTITVYPSSYDTVNSAYYSWVYPASNAYHSIAENGEARARLVSGAGAETKIYWQFDLSSIPVGATILSVELEVKARMSAVNTNYIDSCYFVVCNGLTQVGTPTEFRNTTIDIYTVDGGSGWTRDSIQNLTLLQYVKRGSSNVTSAYNTSMVGADLTVTYKI